MSCLSGGDRYKNLPKNLLTIYLHNVFTAQANDQSFDILLGSQQAFNAQLYIKGRRYTRIFKQFTKN
ncbi:hypothetical protein PHYBLDRAFT_159734 [Phycomyces blakesleeanus NRRL 1555(-)]|uniref:Uncharacterized protein n=1 Tax=Phycomyces blakesleeanus (strain ATCC 8743b / DSM 1359 / FGSC 10004 / NBRC 33097 / NRRL 1555) TaxID=763407 RepID=A0A162NID7_PHYB8|nr:hypothetical protein PHYBLDRAFT_159734 [Phycomyces blakesleeanus NRRL 1555(-)]OAD69964.1 hypothetical protein PHYBLDRAFT_159734 [Phycomyces blakesleeanus NRRL 1555(-)]|eukprot:XP_018288004.1 hypothetical protein PHYBLDRAFT_159734 [Phycomyces blakesleeanus NRRL 1555(-)]